MHKKCQKCRFVRQLMIALLVAGLITVTAHQFDLSAELTMWSAFAGAVLPLMWFGYRQRRQDED